jgi:hypothetical protein
VARAAPRSDRSLWALRGELYLVLTGDRWGVTLGGSTPNTSSLELGDVRIRQIRYPFDLGVRLGWRTGWLRSSVAWQALMAVLRLRAADIPDAATTTRWEWGVRAVANLSTHGSRIAPYLRGSAEFIPVTHQLAVEPRGSIGRTAALWLGGAAGIAGVFD